MTPIQRTQLVFFPLKLTAGAETKFPPIDNLIGDVEILGFTAYDASVLAHTPDQAPVVAAADALNLTVRLYKGTDQLFMDIPYTDLIRAVNAGLWYECVPFVMDITKCTIMANAAIAGPVNAAVMFMYRLVAPR